MTRPGTTSQHEGMAGRPSTPVNLTAAAEPISWAQACEVIGVWGPGKAPALDIRGMTDAENGCINDGAHETVYVVISGFGILCSGGAEIQCTGGDVLFVPRGCIHHFEHLDGDIRMWRVAAVTP